MRAARFALIAAYLAVATLPLAWLAVTSLKDRDDVVSPTARVLPGVSFAPTLKAYAELGEPVKGKSRSFLHFLRNSAVIALTSTLASVALGM